MVSLGARANVPMPHGEATTAGLLESIDTAAIDCSWVANIATKPAQTAAMLDWSEAIRSRLMPLGSVQPRSPGWDSALAAIAGAGLIGIELHPLYQGFNADDWDHSITCAALV